MKSRVDFFGRRRQRWLASEWLEHRLMLDSQMGDALDEAASESGALSKFGSDGELKDFLIKQSVQQYQHLFGQPVWGYWGGPGPWFVGPTMRDALAPDAASEGMDHSETNTQVSGVDEGDLFETDGRFVYLLSNDQLTIVDLRIPEHPRVASRMELPDGSYATDIYLDGDRLAVISSSWSYFAEPWRGGPMVDVAVIGAEPSFAGGTDAWFWPEPGRQRVVATVLDVSDREQPVMAHRTEIDGYLLSSRAIDGKVYLVTHDYLDLPFPEAIPIDDSPTDDSSPSDDPSDGASGADDPEDVGGRLLPPDYPFWTGEPTHVYETEADYRARIEPLILDVLPEYSGFGPGDEQVSGGRLAEAEDIYLSDGATPDMLSVVTVDMRADLPGPHASTSLMSAGGQQIYMSADSLYVFQPTWETVEQTSILKFSVDAASGMVTPTASGQVPGRMLNQFSADEYQGHLRVATTSGWGRESDSAVFVLGQESDQLEIVGRIDGIAPGEDVYAVRFVDSRGYVVTFLRVDPLFVLNLSDSTNPTIEGELHIPGFSEYLHPIDENHLLGIGRHADPQTGARGELQVSLFDVSNAADPRLVDRFSFPGLWGTWSPGEADHLAVSYYPDSQTLALPVTGQTGPPWTWDGGVPPDVVNALYILQIDTEAGIELRGTVEHPSQVMRSARIGQSLISVSWDTLKVSAVDNPADVIGQVHYLPPTIPGSNPPSPSAEDIDVLFREAAAGTGDLTFDRDGNAVVDQDDVEFLVHAVLKTEFGDCDLDGAVDFADFVTLANHFDQQGGWAEGDFDGDGVVGFSDFLLLSSHFNA